MEAEWKIKKKLFFGRLCTAVHLSGTFFEHSETSDRKMYTNAPSHAIL